MSARRLSLLFVLTAISTASGSVADTAPPDHSRAVTSTPPDVLTGTRPLPFFYDLYTFRGRAGRTAIVTAFAVEAGRLETEAADRGVQYRFSVTLVLADTARRSVSITHDTVFVDLPRPLPGDHLLYTHVEVLAPPSTATRQRVIMIDATTPGIGQLYTDYFPIPGYAGSRLMLSDIALGQPDARTGWKRGDVTLALLPTTQFPSSAFDVYYEIYNLPAGRPYTTEIAIEPADSTRAHSDRQPLRLRFAGQSAAGSDASLPELRRVETSLPKGSYSITVTITDQATGEKATRSRRFDVRGWDRGTMMVPALPHRSGVR